MLLAGSCDVTGTCYLGRHAVYNITSAVATAHKIAE